ncbi:MAG: gliding motility-associated C-terminal domain-containing protein [Bacteroidetes bacterium]|nr:gliding motility-associated C-terminal domain-containing protein [Bacteroidota bacterium]
MQKSKKNNGCNLLLSIVLIVSFFSVQGQYALVGNALKTNTTEYRLTPDVMWQNGSVWNTTKIDLKKSFDLSFELNFGIHDINGADGISFTLQQQGTNAGSSGGGLGVFGVTPSLIVEYDTYENTPYSDPIFDHIAIDKNGVIDHGSANNLAGPVQASSTNINIEDGSWHTSRVIWDAVNQKLEVYFDCSLRLTYTGDIITTIFGGNSLVYYGFTAATGGATNEQSIRGFNFAPKTIKMDTTICAGDTIQEDFSGYNTYLWQPATNISSIFSPNPLIYPSISTQYIVTIGNNCLQSWNDTVMINVKAKPVVNLGLDVSICEGNPAHVFDAGNSGYSHLWSTGDTTQTISQSTSGSYSVEVSNGSCTTKDTVLLTLIAKPLLDLGADIDICEGKSATISTAINGAKLLWSTGESTASITCDTSSTIWLKAYYDSNCPVYDTVEISLLPMPISTLVTDTTVCFYEVRSLKLDPGNNAQKFLWEDGSTTQELMVFNSGTYKVELSNGNCSILDSIEVNNLCSASLFIPNAFTPLDNNGDNDIFYVQGINIEDFHLMIFNRWGELLHESYNITEGWNGFYKGLPVQVDVYVWKLEWKEQGDKMHNFGHVTVLN